MGNTGGELGQGAGAFGALQLAGVVFFLRGAGVERLLGLHLLMQEEGEQLLAQCGLLHPGYLACLQCNGGAAGGAAPGQELGGVDVAAGAGPLRFVSMGLNAGRQALRLKAVWFVVQGNCTALHQINPGGWFALAVQHSAGGQGALARWCAEIERVEFCGGAHGRFYSMVNRLKKPVMAKTSRIPSLRLRMVSLPPLAATCLRSVRKRRRPEELM